MTRNKNELIAYELGYRINNNGEIVNPIGDIINGSVYNVVYKKFNIRQNNSYIRIKVHRLIAYQKFGEKIFDENIVVRHLDGNGFNNKYENIEIGSESDNRMDIPIDLRMKLSLNASNIVRKLTDSEILRLQSLYADGYRMKFLMSEFNIQSKGSYHNYLHKFNN